MARKKTILREHILEGAIRILKREGINHLTARNVAKELNCSTQPIYNEFSSMDGLKQEIVKQSDDALINNVFKGSEEDVTLQKVCEHYIEFSALESPLFYSMYVNQHDFSKQLHERLYSELKDVIKKSYPDVNVDQFWTNLYPLVYGLASLIAIGHINIVKIDVPERITQYIKLALELTNQSK